MTVRHTHIAIGLAGIFGTILLSAYFGVGFAAGLAMLPPSATLAQVLHIATQYHTLWLLGTWLQATGSLLSVIFLLGLVHRANAITRLLGILTILGATILLAVVLVEGVFTINLAQAALHGHQLSSLASFDMMSTFTYIYPIVPASLIFLCLGPILLQSNILPRAFGRIALGLGIAFEAVGLIGLFTTPVLTLVVLSLQALWILAAAIVWLKNTTTLTSYTLAD